MKQNACGVDRLVRIAGGLALLWIGTRRATGRGDRTAVSLSTVLLAYGGAELLVSGLTRFCPLNAALGRDTCGGVDDDGDGGDWLDDGDSGGGRELAPVAPQ